MIQASMHLERGEGKSQEFAFHVPAIIGRSKLADVTILHPLISRKHCELTETNDGRLAIRDLDSLNGTYVGESRIKQCVLRPGDFLTLGPFTYRVDYSPETAEDEATEELRSDRGGSVPSEKAVPVTADDPTAYGPTAYDKVSQGTTIESPDCSGLPGGPTAEEDSKATAPAPLARPDEPPDERPNIGPPTPKPVSSEDRALQDFLKRLP